MYTDDFSKEEIAIINEIVEQVGGMLSEYVAKVPFAEEEAEGLRRSFSGLVGLYGKGKKVYGSTNIAWYSAIRS
ncbi:hypothetical protein [Mucilaginibacter pedocola]|uniref:Uncharacterized protein n=1 Tax=Mucilaginibacter pedocola TaxID=1792845 RepID=A0A1S9PA52_9SPHI|nr:hypothetical protein [Mucilaginibacter pedocola]OOQ57854.1 hypothetical protein BC343_13840 [Mucilaginibacter pedocola]